MTMQHRNGSFEGHIVISDLAWAKRDKSAGSNKVRIGHLNMASKTVVERIAADYPGMKPGWFCLRVMMGREFAVEKLLADSDVESLVVRTNEYKVVKRGRVRTVPERPVIAGYVLVHCLPIPAAMMGLLRVDHVMEVIGGGISPYRADEDSITRFKKMAYDGKYDHREKPLLSFMVQEEVRVCDGPFASFDGIVISIDAERFRVKVEVNIFGRSTPVELDIAQIEKL